MIAAAAGNGEMGRMTAKTWRAPAGQTRARGTAADRWALMT